MRSAYAESARRVLEDEGLRRRFARIARTLYPAGGEGVAVAFTSVNPGEGRSTVCLGVGEALAEEGVSTVAVDYNIAHPGLHLMLGEPNFRGITEYSVGGPSPERYGFEDSEGLMVIPVGPIPADPGGWITSVEAAQALASLRASREMVLVDGPVCGDLASAGELLERLDGVVLVVHVGRTGKAEAREALLELRRGGAELAGVVLNGC